MDDPRWLRVITVGLVLAALAVGYYILTGAFSLQKTTPKTQINQVKSATSVVVNTPLPSPTATANPSNPDSAYNRIVARNQTEIQTLPKTGVPAGLIVLLAVSVMISGLGLRKFPH